MLIAANWGVYIYGVAIHHVVETSLGYFINPLFTILLGVVVLRERLRPAQWSAVYWRNLQASNRARRLGNAFSFQFSRVKR